MTTRLDMLAPSPVRPCYCGVPEDRRSERSLEKLHEDLVKHQWQLPRNSVIVTARVYTYFIWIHCALGQNFMFEFGFEQLIFS
jgi:hypothetical protein